MSIAEKLTTVAENVPKVYKAGQDSMVDPDKIIPKSTSGNPVYLDDVSEIPHDVGITLTSDSITDFSDVNVTVCGKNLLPESKYKKTLQYGNVKMTYEGSGIFHIVGTVDATGAAASYYLTPLDNAFIKIEKEKTYTLSAKVISGGYSGTTQALVPYLGLGSPTISGIKNWLPVHIQSTDAVGTKRYEKKVPSSVLADATHLKRFWIYQGINKGEIVTYDIRIQIWLEEGNESTEYEPSNDMVYTANADGTVEGVKSLSPYMNIYSDADVNISVDYHKSYGIDTENKRFWDGVTQSNERTIFTYGFHCWDVEYLRPPYKIKPTAINYAFFSTRNLKYIEKDYFDFSACNTASAFSGSMRNNASLEVIEDCNFPEVNHEGVFMNNPLLTTIERIPVNETMTFTPPNWGGCPKLSEIRFDGVIGTSISFPVSPLSVDSMKNIIGCLKNYSGTDNAGVYSLTLMDSRWIALEADSTAPNGGTWRDYVIGLGWLT